jgi:L-ascorbate metabolism protein UlaG (beta-lactamase superfamily)
MAERRRSILEPQFKPTPELWNPNAITAAWLGHATVLINFYGVTILTDPALFEKVGADSGLGTIGPKRLIAPALTPAELPPIDLVLLSHAHMDHLNSATLRKLPGGGRSVTARATADLLSDTPLKSPVELGWGDKVQVATANGDVQVEAFEVKHWGARWRYDKHRGYNGYIIERHGRKIIFGGDTAFTDSFAALRSKGPFEMAIMPIGAYEPWVQAHCNPEEAVAMADAADAKFVLPMHFKTFAFGREGVTEPTDRLQAALDPARIGWLDVGQTFQLPG